MKIPADKIVAVLWRANIIATLLLFIALLVFLVAVRAQDKPAIDATWSSGPHVNRRRTMIAAQDKKPPKKPASSSRWKPPQKDEPQKLVFSEAVSPEYSTIGRLYWKDGAFVFEGKMAESAALFIAEINKREGEPCGRRALLDALELAERVFLPHPTDVASSVSLPPQPKTAAEALVIAKVMERVERERAVEQAQRDDAAQKIRQTIRSCR